jgi:hypothetical protein
MNQVLTFDFGPCNEPFNPGPAADLGDLSYWWVPNESEEKYANNIVLSLKVNELPRSNPNSMLITGFWIKLDPGMMLEPIDTDQSNLKFTQAHSLGLKRIVKKRHV